ncbi:MAG: hypothetical protein FJY66_03840 [Calditrichaeota bacterium]|nr:hypothetical protein [Calditrichota bacterium]
MNKHGILTLLFAALLGVVGYIGLGQAAETALTNPMPEGNIWTTADGTKFFTCPVMGGEGLVDGAPSFSDVKGVRYYHCCASCQKPFQSNPSKWMKGFAVPGNVYSVDEDGKHFVDPVDSAKGIVSSKTAYHDVNGKRYFCASKKTLKRFEENPQSFLAPPQSEDSPK